MDDSRRLWVARQVKVLLAAGMNPVDAEQTMRQVIAALPDDDTNLMEWLPTQMTFAVDPLTIHDARVAWYSAAPAKFKRILDATR